jgi:hypothetical protein
LDSSCPGNEVRVFVLKGKKLTLRDPNNARVGRDIVPSDNRKLRLVGVEVDVRGWPWVTFSEHGGLGLPLLSRTDKHESLRTHWDNAVIDAWRVTGPRKRKVLFDD